ncbi:LAGLIDADG family homing endonuclease [Bacillus sp. SG-1]|uniref:LAGLIDADG family homing endonuclease n=1 Tax=Bacillus sp. SG-1 TaxID=161544 RepID=UPI0012EA26A5|nr:LAGLIDADG family homing endonuclease [Bacillus sp. SG-1]
MLKDWEAAYFAGIIDGEGSISLTRLHENEHRRPIISIASTDRELLVYLKELAGGSINNKKNYKPERHKNSYTLVYKSKKEVLYILRKIHPYLRVSKKKQRALWILNHYERVTKRNGKYSRSALKEKLQFEEDFFNI